MSKFASTMFTTWVGGTLAVMLLAWPALKVIIFVLKLLLGAVYALSGNAPADWEGVF